MDLGVRGVLSKAAGSLLDVLYPPRCVGCGCGIPAKEQPLCGRCMRGLERVDPTVLASHVQANVEGFRASSIFALWVFDKGGALQRAQHSLKYGQRPSFGLRLGSVLASAWCGYSSMLPDVIVPIPLHRARLYERGYNQSLALARGMTSVMAVAVDESLLQRSSATRRQTGLSREARQENVRGAFESDEAARGLHVLLLDDVVTTGATASAAIDVLLDSGAARVDFAALAHART